MLFRISINLKIASLAGQDGVCVFGVNGEKTNPHDGGSL